MMIVRVACRPTRNTRQALLALAQRYDLPVATGWGHLWPAWLAYEADDLDVAIDHGVCNEPSFMIGLENMGAVVDQPPIRKPSRRDLPRTRIERHADLPLPVAMPGRGLHACWVAVSRWVDSG